MIFARRVLSCFLICAPLVCAAGTGAAPRDEASDLKGKVVFLRGMESSDKLNFDAQGAPIETDTAGSFAYSGVKIKKVHRSETELEIKSERVALIFATSSESPSLKDLQYIPLREPVSITIALDASHPEGLDAATQKVFAFNSREALLGKSADEVQADLATIASLATTTEAPEKGTPLAASLVAGAYRTGESVTPPRLIHSVDPDFPSSARQHKTGGICTLSLIVNTDGRPSHIRILVTSDADLNRAAIEALSQYRFAPAIYHGKPVPVYIKVEVNFRIY